MKRFENFYKFLLLFSWLTIPPIFRVGGAVNLNWLYITLLDIILFLIFLIKLFNETIIVKNYLKILLLFYLYLIFSIFWSYSPVDSLRYLNKILLILLIPLCFSNNNLEDKIIHEKIFTALIFFLIVNWISEFTIKRLIWSYPAGEFFEGLSGRHAIKYYVVFGAIFSILSYYYLKNKIYLIVFCIVLITLFFIFQRGAFLGLIVGLLASFYHILKGKIKYRLAFLSFSILLVFVLMYVLLFTDKGVLYTFYSYDYRDKFLLALSKDPLYAVSYIDFKGRLEYWDVLLSKANFIYGLGFGSSGRIIEENFGFYNEVHNDWLQILIETGIIGLFLYLLFWNRFISYLLVLIKKNLNEYQKIFIFSALAYSNFIIVNGLIDHVIDYQSAAITMGILISIVSKYQNIFK